MISWFDVLLHQMNERHLDIDHQQRHPGILELLREAGVIDVIVRGETILDFTQWDVRPTEVRAHRAHRARPAEVDQHSRSAGANHPVIRRAVADVDDRYGGTRHSADGSTERMLPHAKRGVWCSCEYCLQRVVA